VQPYSIKQRAPPNPLKAASFIQIAATVWIAARRHPRSTGLAAMSELAEHWRIRIISEAQSEGHSHLRVTYSGCGKITDLPLPMILRRSGITRNTLLGNIKLRCAKCGRNDPVLGKY
jgi:hypothetical protein